LAKAAAQQQLARQIRTTMRKLIKPEQQQQAAAEWNAITMMVFFLFLYLFHL